MPVCTHACVSACVCVRVEFTAERAAFVWPVPRRDCDVLGDSSFEADLLWRPVCQTLETAALLSLSGSHSDRGPRARRGPGPQVGLSSLPPLHRLCSQGLRSLTSAPTAAGSLAS